MKGDILQMSEAPLPTMEHLADTLAAAGADKRAWLLVTYDFQAKRFETASNQPFEKIEEMVRAMANALRVRKQSKN